MLRTALVILALAAQATAFVGPAGPARLLAAPSRPSALVMKFSPIKSGVTVKVIAGDDKGKTGKVLSVDRKEHKKKNGPFVVVEGVNIVTKHVKPRARGETGKRVQREGPIHISNVQAVEAAAGDA